MKKTLRKMQLARETLRHLGESAPLEQIAGGQTVAPTVPDNCSLPGGPCNGLTARTCPPPNS
jgi:hypothetical protein